MKQSQKNIHEIEENEWQAIKIHSNIIYTSYMISLSSEFFGDFWIFER